MFGMKEPIPGYLIEKKNKLEMEKENLMILDEIISSSY
jgi:hypothetical protein